MSTSIPDIYRYEAQRIDTLLFNDVYGYFTEHNGLGEGSESYRKGDASYLRTIKPISFQGLMIHLQSEPLVPGWLFRQQRGMIVELTAIGTNIEVKLEDVLQKFNFKVKERNPF